MLARRPVLPGDVPFLEGLYAETRDDLAALDVPGHQRAALISMQHSAQQRHYQQQFPCADHSILLLDDTPVGQCVIDGDDTQIRLVDLAVSAAARRQGVATTLLRQVQGEARESGRSVSLHVLRTNPARYVYARCGFTTVADTGTHLRMEWRPEVTPGDA